MLQRIRERAHGWIAWVIFSFIAFTFAIWGVHNYLQNSDDTSIAASIDGRNIHAADVQQLTEQMRLQSQAQMGEQALANPLFDKILKQQALQSLIRSAVLLKSAEKQGFALDEDQILLTLRRIPEFQENGQFSQERFNNLLRHLNLNGEQFYARVYQDMLIEQLQDQFANSTFILQSDIDQIAALMNQQREVNYFLLNSAAILDKVAVSAAEIEKYYQSHAQQFQIPAQVSVEYVTLTMADLQTKAAVTDQEIAAYYDANKESFSDKPQWKISYILKNADAQETAEKTAAIKQQLADIRIKATQGTPFEQLAREHSDDVLTKNKGGDLGWMRVGTLDESFEKIMANMKKPGEISEPAKTKYGYVLLRVEDYQPGKSKPLAEASAAISKILQQQKSEKVFAQASEMFANLSFEQPNSLQPVADALKLTIKQSDYFDRDGGNKQGIAQYPTVVKAAFSDDVLVAGNNSEVLQPTPDSLIVLRLKQQIPARTKPLKEVQGAIVAELKAAKARTHVETRGKQILEQLQHNPTQSLSSIAQDFPGVTWKVKTLSRFTPDRTPAETDAFQENVFNLPRPSAAKPVLAGYPLAEGYAIVKLNSVNQSTLSAEKMKEQQDYLRSLLQRRYAYLVRDLYIQSLVNQAKVKIHQSAESTE